MDQNRATAGRSNKFDAASKASTTFAIAASSSAAWLVFYQLDFQTPGGLLFAIALSLVAGVCAYFSFRKLLKHARRRALLFAVVRGASAALLSFLVTAALLALGVTLADFVQSVGGRPASPVLPALLQSMNLGGTVLLAGAAMYAWLPTLVGSVISVVLEWTILRAEPTHTRQ